MTGYLYEPSVNYTLELKQKDLPEPSLIEVNSGDQLTGTVINKRADEYLIKVAPGQVLSVTMKLSTPEGSGTLSLIDPQGLTSLFASSLDGELTFGPITLNYVGEYILKITTYANVDATYEIWFELN